MAGRQSTARSSSAAPDDGADASVDVANGLLMVLLLRPAHTRASWGKKGPRRSRKSDARRRAGWVFAGCPCASDPDVALGRYIAGAERRVPGAVAAAVVGRGGERGGRRRWRLWRKLTGHTGVFVLSSMIKYWVLTLARECSRSESEREKRVVRKVTDISNLSEI